MEYLQSVLGIRVAYNDYEITGIPNFIHDRYHLRNASLDGIRTVFVYPQADLESVDAVNKHLQKIRTVTGAPAVLVLDRLTYHQKEYLLRDHIPFVVDRKQIYLPFMAVYLQQRADAEQPAISEMLPSAQVLLLSFIYRGCGELLTSVAAADLSFTATSISRASRQLEDLNLVQTQRRGVQKVLSSDKSPRELFETAQAFLPNPVKRIIYVPKKEISGKLFKSGYSALSDYSMMNPPIVGYYATKSLAAWENKASNSLQDSTDQCTVELWRYDPGKLSKGGDVDRLSLALALREDGDERTHTAIEEMLAELWREIDGKRNH